MKLRKPSPRAGKVITWAAVPAAILASGLVVGQASFAAFSATTASPTSNWSAGTVALADDDSNTALFTASNLKPGDTGTKCITVTSSGSLPAAVKLYGTSAATTNSLSANITLAVVQGTGGSYANCTGFTPLSTGSSLYGGSLAGFASSATNFATGLGTWAPTGSAAETRTYKFTYTLDAAAPNSSQGGTAAIGFTWESQNTP